MQPNRKHSYSTKVNACADYLIGKKKMWQIELEHGVNHITIVKWIRARKCFKLRAAVKGKRK